MAHDGSGNPALPHLSCPNCGAGFDWHARFSQVVVCESCSSAIVVDREAVKVAGQMSVLAQTPGPLWVGATGKIGRRKFHVMGRVRYGYEGGYWDEWYLAEPDGRTFWIGEDENEFTITHLSEREMPDSFWERAQPGARLSYGEHSYLVQERDEAVCEGGEGQLPFLVLPGERTPFVELVAPGGQFITVERDEGTDRPADFRSTVTFSEPGEDPVTALIRMNHPGSYPPGLWGQLSGQTYKFSQAHWNPENLRQTTLQVLHDPGWLLKWIGSVMVCAGITVMFYLVPRKRTQEDFREGNPDDRTSTRAASVKPGEKGSAQGALASAGSASLEE